MTVFSSNFLNTTLLRFLYFSQSLYQSGVNRIRNTFLLYIAYFVHIQYDKLINTISEMGGQIKWIILLMQTDTLHSRTTVEGRYSSSFWILSIMRMKDMWFFPSDSDGTVVILKVTGDNEYESEEDEEVMQAVFEIFKENHPELEFEEEE